MLALELDHFNQRAPCATNGNICTFKIYIKPQRTVFWEDIRDVWTAVDSNWIAALEYSNVFIIPSVWYRNIARMLLHV